MSNLFWYNFLGIIGLGFTAFSIYKKRCLTELSTWIVFYLFATSITWLGEFTVLGLFSSYAYKPGMFTDPWAENLLGHLILNSTLWPGMAILVTSYSLGYQWICLLSAGNVLIEYLFVKFGMYEHHWWEYYMTACAVVLFLPLVKKWFAIMNQERHGGQILEQGLMQSGLTVEQLRTQLNNMGITSFRDVTVAFITPEGNLYADKRNNTQKQ